MKRISRAVFFVFSLFAACASTVYAQSCPATLTYTPANPVLGQPITVSFAVPSTPPPTPTSNDQYLATITATELGVPQLSVTSLTAVPNGSRPFTYTFTPYAPGQLTVSATGLSHYAFGSIAICGEQINAAPITITIPGAPPAGVLNQLHGQYAFIIQGSLPQAKGVSQTVAVAGSFTADGQGGITDGIEDINSGLGSYRQVPFTGTYSIDPTGRGTLNIRSAGRTEQLLFLIPPSQSTTPLARAGLFVDDGYFLFGNGTLMKQTQNLQTSYPGGPSGSFDLTLRGDFPCSSTCTSGAPVYETGLISFSFGSNSIQGSLLGSAGSVVVPAITASGTYQDVNPITGRFTYSLSQGSFPNLNFIGYSVDATHFFTISTDSHATTYLLSGTAVAE